MPLVFRNAEGDACISMTAERLRAHDAITEGFIFDTTPFSGEKRIRGAYPQMNSDRFCSDLSTNITSEVFVELPQEMFTIYQSCMTVPNKFFVLQTDDNLLIVYFGENYKVSVKTRVPHDDELEDPTDKELQRLALDYFIYELTAQGFNEKHELQTSLYFVLDYISFRLSEIARRRKA